MYWPPPPHPHPPINPGSVTTSLLVEKLFAKILILNFYNNNNLYFLVLKDFINIIEINFFLLIHILGVIGVDDRVK